MILSLILMLQKAALSWIGIAAFFSGMSLLQVQDSFPRFGWSTGIIIITEKNLHWVVVCAVKLKTFEITIDFCLVIIIAIVCFRLQPSIALIFVFV